MGTPLAVLEPTSEAPQVIADLHAELERRLFVPMHKAGVAETSVIVTKRPLPTEARRMSHGTWAVASSYERDPVLVRDDGIMRAPEFARHQLHALYQQGADPDLLYVIRQLPASWSPGTPPPKMVEVETVRAVH